MTSALAVVEKHLANQQFDAAILAEEVGISPAQLNDKLQTLLGQQGGQFIMTARLQCAAEILQEADATVGAAASRVGFKSAGYFARCFKKRFGCLPSAFLENEIQ